MQESIQSQSGWGNFTLAIQFLVCSCGLIFFEGKLIVVYVKAVSSFKGSQFISLLRFYKDAGTTENQELNKSLLNP